MDPFNPNSNSIPYSKSNPIPIHIPNSTFFSSSDSTSFSYFTQQALRAGFAVPDPDPRRKEFEYLDNPMDVPASVQRELEKQRIRAEILAEERIRRRILEEEVAEERIRRRILEEEVRRELMMEKEIGFCHPDLGFPGPMWADMRVPLLTNYEPRDRAGVSTHREVGIRGGGGLDRRPFQRGPMMAGIGDGVANEDGGGLRSGVMLEEIKEVQGAVESTPDALNKDKVIILAKPTPNLPDLKRKALTLCAGDAAELSRRTKTKEDWSCALCRITATSERALNEHLQGKKHKTRERGMVAQRTGFGTSLLPDTSTNTGKPIKAPVVSSIPSSNEDGKEGGAISLVKVDNVVAGKPSVLDANNTLLKGKETPLEKKENGVANKPAAGKPKKKFRFFCEMCKIGAFSLKVFSNHKNGKRHLANLAKLNKTENAPAEASSDKGASAESKEPELAIEELDGADVESVENNEASIGDMNPVVDKDVVFEIGDVTMGCGCIEENKERKLAVEGIKGGAQAESVV